MATEWKNGNLDDLKLGFFNMSAKPRLIEVIVVVCMVWTALAILLAPFRFWAVPELPSSYVLMLAIENEPVIGALGLGLAAALGVGIAFARFGSFLAHVRLWSMAFSGGYLAVVGCITALLNPLGVLIPAMIVFGVSVIGYRPTMRWQENGRRR